MPERRQHCVQFAKLTVKVSAGAEGKSLRLHARRRAAFLRSFSEKSSLEEIIRHRSEDSLRGLTDKQPAYKAAIVLWTFGFGACRASL